MSRATYVSSGDDWVNTSIRLPVKLFLVNARVCSGRVSREGRVPVSAFPCTSREVKLVRARREEGIEPVRPERKSDNDWREERGR